ncbi:MAG TPA: hypothetical protein VKY37_10965 [Brumimicrobium sp.]|nr:hypothetical protein [Brumimicrobium sp.]
MKIQLITILSIVCLLLLTFSSSAQNVGINPTGAAPDNSALLDLNSTDKGFLITRVDTASIATPAFGLMTLAPIDSCLYMYSGANWISLGGVGSNCCCANSSPPPSPDPIFPCNGTTTPVIDVISPLTGETWMDRNLGAGQVATSITDAAAYGGLYQWGRCTDGHEKRTSSTNSTLSTTVSPSHGDFIISSGAPDDWLTPQNNNLWQGVAGINNPCPTGYRIPTRIEMDAERLSWATNDAAGAFASPLKFTLGGRRNPNGAFSLVGSIGSYSTSVISGATNKILLNITNSTSSTGSNARGHGLSVRCIKD